MKRLLLFSTFITVMTIWIAMSAEAEPIEFGGDRDA
jgi:hypothetical protein